VLESQSGDPPSEAMSLLSTSPQGPLAASAKHVLQSRHPSAFVPGRATAAVQGLLLSTEEIRVSCGPHQEEVMISLPRFWGVTQPKKPSCAPPGLPPGLDLMAPK
ncbi:unnamed protein product, partial [Polarella glacialis]